MIFNGYYFQWTAMGTPLAVSYANIFVSMFELNMLLEYQNKCKPTSWLRFTDDTFLFGHGMRNLWNIDVTVKLEKNGTLSTTLFAKPTASYHYLHVKSSHPFHTMKIVAKLQFVKIPRICAFTSENWKHANLFIRF